MPRRPDEVPNGGQVRECHPIGARGAGSEDPRQAPVYFYGVRWTHNEVPATGHQAVGDQPDRVPHQGRTEPMLEGAIVGGLGETQGRLLEVASHVETRERLARRAR